MANDWLNLLVRSAGGASCNSTLPTRRSRFLQSVVESLRYSAAIFITIDALMRTLETATIDLIILDWTLPEDEGAVTLTQIQSLTSHVTPIVVVTD